MNTIDDQYYKLGFQHICGVDEAGRGPWAGPVFVAAVILPKNHGIQGIDDSKKLSEQKRESLSAIIKEKALSYAIEKVSNTFIDKTDIVTATKSGMQKAIKKLSTHPDILLLDAVNISVPEICQIQLVKGDARSESIAAASILAKVERDLFMISLHDKYPAYNFRSHKGYGTKEHAEALQKYGPCPFHRKSFQPVKAYL